MTQAVLEGVAFAFPRLLRVLNRCRDRHERAFAVGGGAKSDVWLTILASVLDRPARPLRRGGCRGGVRRRAARHGGPSGRRSPGPLMPPPRVERTMAPDPTLVGAYAERYERYRTLYPLARAAG